jgi:putative DNA primase/helicase
LHLIPFNVRIPDEERVGNMEELLKAEYSGVLNWLVEGCYKWQNEGLTKPAEIAEATSEYRESEDIIASFIKDTYLPLQNGEQGGWQKTSQVYANYKDWCDKNSYIAINSRRFANAMKEAGFQKHHFRDGDKYQIGTLKTIKNNEDELPYANEEVKVKTEYRSEKTEAKPKIQPQQPQGPPLVYGNLKGPNGEEDYIY